MSVVNHVPEHAPPATAGTRRTWRSWFDGDEPHSIRGPFARWPRATDAALAVAVFGVSIVAVTASALDDGAAFTVAAVGDRPVGAFALLAVAAAALVGRRRRPIAATGIVVAAMVVWALAGYGDGQDLALIVAVYSVGRYCANNLHSVATAAMVAVITIADTIIDTNQRIDIAPALILTALPWYVGRRVRNRGAYLRLLQERAARLEDEQQARADQAVADERARIARELHDVVAHRVSMMTVQAGAARTVARTDLDAAIEAMGDVEGEGRQALGELRHLLGVLRPGSAGADDLGPQPGLADLARLTNQLGRTGADVSLTIADLPTGPPAAVELSAYRIVQESFTNIVKHAGPNPTVTITVGFDEDALIIDVTNTTDTTPGPPGTGYGIASMRERATLLGGSLTAAPVPPDRFRVAARLPVPGEPT